MRKDALKPFISTAYLRRKNSSLFFYVEFSVAYHLFDARDFAVHVHAARFFVDRKLVGRTVVIERSGDCPRHFIVAEPQKAVGRRPKR